MGTRRRDTQTISEWSFVLQNGDVANQGESCGLDTATGTARPMGSSATQIFIGFFAAALALGDGTKKVRVSFPNEIEAEWLKNDAAPNDVSAASIGSEVYAKDARTVSTLATGRSKAGRVIDFDASSNLVLVQGGTAVTGPAGAGSIFGAVADRAGLKAVGVTSRTDGQTVLVQTDNSLWRFAAASVQTVDGADELVIAPTVGTGRWVRADKCFIMKLAISKDTADLAVLMTTPQQMCVRPTGFPFWEVTTGWTGGVVSAIGIDSSAIDGTAGDILGGAGGDVTATLGTVGIKAGTVGTKFDSFAEWQAFFLKAGDTIMFNRIASLFAAGAGFVHIPVMVQTVA